MPKFIFTAKNAAGEVKGGEMMADDEKSLAQQLEANGLLVISSKKVEEENLGMVTDSMNSSNGFSSNAKMIAVAISVIFFLIVGGYFMYAKDKSAPVEKQVEVKEKPAFEMTERQEETAQTVPKAEPMTADLKASEEAQAAARAGEKMECVFRRDSLLDGTLQRVLFQVDGEKYKQTIRDDSGVHYDMSDGVAMYSWKDGEKTGNRILIDCMQKTFVSVGMSEEKFQSELKENSIRMLSGVTGLSCRKVDSIDVSLPSDVVFQDDCQGDEGEKFNAAMHELGN